jgi:hypothetical protein
MLIGAVADLVILNPPGRKSSRRQVHRFSELSAEVLLPPVAQPGRDPCQKARFHRIQNDETTARGQPRNCQRSDKIRLGRAALWSHRVNPR